jgi:hypothetical protein
MIRARVRRSTPHVPLYTQATFVLDAADFAAIFPQRLVGCRHRHRYFTTPRGRVSPECLSRGQPPLQVTEQRACAKANYTVPPAVYSQVVLHAVPRIVVPGTMSILLCNCQLLFQRVKLYYF